MINDQLRRWGQPIRLIHQVTYLPINCDPSFKLLDKGWQLRDQLITYVVVVDGELFKNRCLNGLW